MPNLRAGLKAMARKLAKQHTLSCLFENQYFFRLSPLPGEKLSDYIRFRQILIPLSRTEMQIIID